MQGKLISISGMDGAGKSTQIELLRNNLIRLGYKCKYKQFDASDYGDKAEQQIAYYSNFDVIFTRLCIDWTDRYPLIKDFVYNEKLQNVNLAKAVTSVFAGGCMQVYECCIKPLIERGIHVVSDRFWFDDIIYRGLWIEEKFIRELYNTVPSPDLSILLTVPVEVSRNRNQERIDGKSPLMQDVNKIEEVYHKFLELAEKESMLVINGTRSKEIISNDILELVKPLL